MKITIGDIEYEETDTERVWLHFIMADGKPYIFASVAANIQEANAMGQLQGKVIDTFPLMDVFVALKNIELTDVYVLPKHLGKPSGRIM